MNPDKTSSVTPLPDPDYLWRGLTDQDMLDLSGDLVNFGKVVGLGKHEMKELYNNPALRGKRYVRTTPFYEEAVGWANGRKMLRIPKKALATDDSETRSHVHFVYIRSSAALEHGEIGYF